MAVSPTHVSCITRQIDCHRNGRWTTGNTSCFHGRCPRKVADRFTVTRSSSKRPGLDHLAYFLAGWPAWQATPSPTSVAKIQLTAQTTCALCFGSTGGSWYWSAISRACPSHAVTTRGVWLQAKEGAFRQRQRHRSRRIWSSNTRTSFMTYNVPVYDVTKDARHGIGTGLSHGKCPAIVWRRDVPNR